MSHIVNAVSTVAEYKVGSTVPIYAEKNLRVGPDGGLITCHPSVALMGYQFFLTQTGNGLGNPNMNGNYAAAPVDYYYEATGGGYDLYSVTIAISDNVNFNQSDYGGITAGTIVNGLKFFVRMANGVEFPMLSGFTVTANYHWASISHDVRLTTFAGNAQTLIANIDMIAQYGVPLHYPAGWRFICRLNDNFTGLIMQTIGLRGKKY